jgi:hypothetical protein
VADVSVIITAALAASVLGGIIAVSVGIRGGEAAHSWTADTSNTTAGVAQLTGAGHTSLSRLTLQATLQGMPPDLPMGSTPPVPRQIRRPGLSPVFTGNGINQEQIHGYWRHRRLETGPRRCPPLGTDQPGVPGRGRYTRHSPQMSPGVRGMRGAGPKPVPSPGMARGVRAPCQRQDPPGCRARELVSSAVAAEMLRAADTTNWAPKVRRGRQKCVASKPRR